MESSTCYRVQFHHREVKKMCKFHQNYSGVRHLLALPTRVWSICVIDGILHSPT